MKEIHIAQELHKKLSKLNSLQKLDSSGEPLSWSTSLNLVEIVQSAKQIDKYISTVLNTDDLSVIDDCVNDIGEDIRHIMYHIDQLSIYSYLK